MRTQVGRTVDRPAALERLRAELEAHWRLRGLARIEHLGVALEALRFYARGEHLQLSSESIRDQVTTHTFISHVCLREAETGELARMALKAIEGAA